jgi:hypothetical protein
MFSDHEVGLKKDLFVLHITKYFKAGGFSAGG